MRLGIDLGTNSIGWWLYQTAGDGQITKHMNGGVRIFSDGRDPKSKASLAVARRDARSARRRRDRYLRRRSVLMEKLVAAGLMPKDPLERKALEKLDPYELRARGLEDKLELKEIGRAIFHLNQRRGFKSNRKTDSGDNESGKIKDGSRRLDDAMAEAGAKTYGQYLHKRRLGEVTGGTSVRTRLGTIQDGEREITGYDFYPTRALFEKEYAALWQEQSTYYPTVLTSELRDEIERIIFFQRPLKTPKVGLCFFENEERIAKAHPLFQERRLYETINGIRVIEEDSSKRVLTLDERDALVALCQTQKSIKYTILKKTIKLSPVQSLSLERSNSDKIDGNSLRAEMTAAFGSQWSALDLSNQWSIINAIRTIEHHNELLDFLVSNFDISLEVAEKLSNVKMEDGYGRLGETASKQILNLLKQEVITYSEAAGRIYGSHSDDRTGEILEELPYYGEILQRHVIPGSMDESQHDPIKDAAEYWGRITNPTVHIGLNQLRKLVNDIIQTYGKPNRIVVELARDLKNSEAQKKEINKNIKSLTEAAQKRSEKLEEIGVKNTGEARLRMRLWEESHPDVIKRCCPYCSKPLNIRSLFDSSTDIDHILPYSRTLDDSPSNKVICHANCNRNKANKTPYEAWFGSPRWDDIAKNLDNLPKNKRWRFYADAMEKYEGERHFEQRQLTDTQYLSRIAKAYLSRLYPDPEKAPVQVVPGQMTEMLRRKWKLNELLSDASDYQTAKEKNRQDHRHHAIDAAVIAATDAGLLQRISKSSARNEDSGRSVVAGVEPPFTDFCPKLKIILDNIIVSHKQDHGSVSYGSGHSTSSQLHNDTAYGLLEDGKVVTRKPLDTFKPADIDRIRDDHLKKVLKVHTNGLSGKDFDASLKSFAQVHPIYKGIRRARVVETLSVIPFTDADGKIYKGYKGDSNHCAEVWQLLDGTWTSVVLTSFNANKFGLGHSRPHPAAKLVMRLFNKDNVVLEHPKAGFIHAIISQMGAKQLILSPPNQANVDARNRNKDDPFKFWSIGFGTFKKYNLRKIGVDRLGQINDPLKK